MPRKEPAVCCRRNICLHGCWTSLPPESPGCWKRFPDAVKTKLTHFEKMEALWVFLCNKFPSNDLASDFSKTNWLWFSLRLWGWGSLSLFNRPGPDWLSHYDWASRCERFVRGIDRALPLYCSLQSTKKINSPELLVSFGSLSEISYFNWVKVKLNKQSRQSPFCW